LLFTVAFTNLFLGGLARFLGDKLGDLTGRQLVSGGFLLGGILHLLVLCASVQVPGKLGWHQDFKKLQPLNRKVFWTYGAYIFFIIVFMSIVSFVLAKEPSSVAAALWAAFIALFWWARVGTDFFYMNHDDWPEGPLFKVGHVCLTTVFVLLAVIYSGELVWTLVGA
jgi:alginate O-acetyltransferase complex protein AlgI